ncbi:hypothetical protein Hanom_Chr02g00129771 [Helianthus anomalus]
MMLGFSVGEKPHRWLDLVSNRGDDVKLDSSLFGERTKEDGCLNYEINVMLFGGRRRMG